MEDLSKKSYWDERFLVEDEFEWFGQCSRLYPVFNLYFQSSPSFLLLHLGCGSSSLAEEMFSRRYCRMIFNVDYSFQILQKRRSKKFDSLPIDWITLDIRSMPLKSNFFDTIVEKGTLDVFFVGHEHQLWKPSDELKEKIDSILTQISECLQTNGGLFFSISFQQPHFRRPFLAKTKYRWSIDVHNVSESKESVEYFVYVMTKGKTMNEEDRLLEQGKSDRWSWINASSYDSIVTNACPSVDESDDEFLLKIDLE